MQRWFWYISSMIWFFCFFCFLSTSQKRMAIWFWPGNLNLFLADSVTWTSISQTQQHRPSCFDTTGVRGMLGKKCQSRVTSDTRTHCNSRNINTGSIHVSPWSSWAHGLLMVLSPQWQFLVTLHHVRRIYSWPAISFVAHSSLGCDWGDRVRTQGSRVSRTVIRNCLLWIWPSCCWSSWML